MDDQAAKGEDFSQAWSIRNSAVPNHAAKMMIVGAGARVLFYPTLIYNVVRSKLQQEFHWWDEIDQFLVLGAVPFPGDVPRLKDAGVHAVVTLNESYETLVETSFYKVSYIVSFSFGKSTFLQRQGVDHLVIPTRDYLFAPSFTDIQRAVAFIHGHAQRGRRTYVHCKAGRGRSTTVVICYLVKHRGMTPLEAFHYVKSKRPRILLAASQWQAIVDYNKQCQRRLTFEEDHKDRNACQECDEIPEFGPGSLDETSCELVEKVKVEFKTSSRTQELEDIDCINLVNESEELVLISTKDLIGYRSIEDAGLVGNEVWWKDNAGLVCRLRVLKRVGRASRAWAKFSGLWVTPTGEASTSSSSSSCKQMAGSIYGGSLEALPSAGIVN